MASPLYLMRCGAPKEAHSQYVIDRRRKTDEDGLGYQWNRLFTVVWYAWDGRDFYFSTLKDRAKYKNIKRNPAISLIVDDSVNHVSVTAYGRAEIIERDIAELTRPIIEKYVPEAQREGALKGIVNDPNRVLIVLHPERIIP